MERFSKIVYSLYEAAQGGRDDDAAAELLRIVRGYLGFDGAVLGMGTRPPGGGDGLVIDTACVTGRDESILSDYAPLAQNDPITAVFQRGLSAPFACNCGAYYGRRRLRELRAFVRRHDIVHLLLYGVASTPTASARWLAAYRGAGAPFDAQAAAQMAALWPHLQRCHAAARHALLGRLSRAAEARQGFALLSRMRVLDAADPAFIRLFQLEWPYESGYRLPAAVWHSLAENLDYIGLYVRVTVRRESGHVVCRIAERNGFESLTPAERTVALQFGKGLSHGEIALNLAVSRNTVRTHVAHVYEKLSIHTKAELVRRLAVLPARGKPL